MNRINLIISSLCGFNIKDDPLIKAYAVFANGSETECLEAYSTIYRILALQGKDLSAYLRDMIKYSDSPVIDRRTVGWDQVVEHDAAKIEDLSYYGGSALKQALCDRFKLAVFCNLPVFEEGDHVIDPDVIMNDVICGRTGRFAKYKAYTFDGEDVIDRKLRFDSSYRS